MQLKIASRKKVKIKLAISAPTGFGKTYSALLMAYGMTGDWAKIAVIDSENQSAELYSDLGPYNHVSMTPDYTVDKFCTAVKLCTDAGMEVIIVDSTYHYWHGKGGMLEYNSNLGGKYQDWAKTNKVYSRWLDTILQTPVHFICTSRKKQAYEIVKTDGKTTVEKKGMEDEVRNGFDYEMTVAFNIINDKHFVEAGKDRTRLFTGKQEFVITPDTGKLIKQWCDEGIEAIDPVAGLIASVYLIETIPVLEQYWKSNPSYHNHEVFKAAVTQQKAKLTTPGTTNEESKEHQLDQLYK